MANVNPSVILRSLIIYAVVVPLAIIVGYMLTNPQDYQTIGLLAVLTGVLVFPLLMKWHYPLLIFSCNFAGVIFFLPGHPTMFLAMVATSLTISVVERILTRTQRFLPTGGVGWPLLAMLCVVWTTAKLTGGFGLKSMGARRLWRQEICVSDRGHPELLCLYCAPHPAQATESVPDPLFP